MSYAVSTDGLGMWVGMVLSNSSSLDAIPGFSDTLTSPSSSALAFAARDFNNGTIKMACGQFGAGFNYMFIPLSYLPSSCQCTDIINFYDTGTGGC